MLFKNLVWQQNAKKRTFLIGKQPLATLEDKKTLVKSYGDFLQDLLQQGLSEKKYYYLKKLVEDAVIQKVFSKTDTFDGILDFYGALQDLKVDRSWQMSENNVMEQRDDLITDRVCTAYEMLGMSCLSKMNQIYRDADAAQAEKIRNLLRLKYYEARLENLNTRDYVLSKTGSQKYQGPMLKMAARANERFHSICLAEKYLDTTNWMREQTDDTTKGREA